MFRRCSGFEDGRTAERGQQQLVNVRMVRQRRAGRPRWDVGLSSLPAEPLTVARYLAARAGSGASIATMRLAASAITKAHEWAKMESPCRDPGVRASLKGWGRRLAKPQRQACVLTADVLSVIRLTAVQTRKRGRGIETPEQAAERERFDLPWWRHCPTRGYAVPRLRLSPGAPCSAGKMAAVASP